MTVIEEIAAERQRQLDKEGWSLSHDDDHTDGSLAAAAAAYAYFSTFETRTREPFDRKEGFVNILRLIWPHSWDWYWWKPKSRRRDLIRAGALIVAEIERLDRAEETNKAA